MRRVARTFDEDGDLARLVDKDFRMLSIDLECARNSNGRPFKCVAQIAAEGLLHIRTDLGKERALKLGWLAFLELDEEDATGCAPLGIGDQPLHSDVLPYVGVEGFLIRETDHNRLRCRRFGWHVCRQCQSTEQD